MAVTKLSVSDVRNRVNDAGEIKKGQTILDQGKLRHLARTDNKLYADAAGSGGSTYQVSITFDDAGKVLGRRGRQGNCSCRAAWGRDFCKHSVALLLAWSKTPEAFVVTELPAEDEPKPGGDAAPGSAPRKRSKKPGGAAPKVDGLHSYPDLKATLTWSGPIDMDIAVVDRRGRRLSALRREVIRVREGEGEETLTMQSIDNPVYIEVSRPGGEGRVPPVQATLKIKTNGATRSFDITSDHSTLRLAKVYWTY